MRRKSKVVNRFAAIILYAFFIASIPMFNGISTIYIHHHHESKPVPGAVFYSLNLQEKEHDESIFSSQGTSSNPDFPDDEHHHHIYSDTFCAVQSIFALPYSGKNQKVVILETLFQLIHIKSLVPPPKA